MYNAAALRSSSSDNHSVYVRGKVTPAKVGINNFLVAENWVKFINNNSFAFAYLIISVF
jgi:hypothetical protein